MKINKIIKKIFGITTLVVSLTLIVDSNAWRGGRGGGRYSAGVRLGYSTPVYVNPVATRTVVVQNESDADYAYQQGLRDGRQSRSQNNRAGKVITGAALGGIMGGALGGGKGFAGGMLGGGLVGALV